jgi:hypothetical protein
MSYQLSEPMSIKSKPNAVRGATDSLRQSATVETVGAHRAMELADSLALLPKTAQQQRIEQMYQLANIFASIFEALSDEHLHAIATTREAA